MSIGSSASAGFAGSAPSFLDSTRAPVSVVAASAGSASFLAVRRFLAGLPGTAPGMPPATLPAALEDRPAFEPLAELVFETGGSAYFSTTGVSGAAPGLGFNSVVINQTNPPASRPMIATSPTTIAGRRGFAACTAKAGGA